MLRLAGKEWTAVATGTVESGRAGLTWRKSPKGLPFTIMELRNDNDLEMRNQNANGGRKVKGRRPEEMSNGGHSGHHAMTELQGVNLLQAKMRRRGAVCDK